MEGVRNDHTDPPPRPHHQQWRRSSAPRHVAPCGSGAEASQPSLDPALRCSHAPCSASTGRMPSPSPSRSGPEADRPRTGPTPSSEGRHSRSVPSSPCARCWSACAASKPATATRSTSWRGARRGSAGHRPASSGLPGVRARGAATAWCVSTIVEVRNRRGHAYSALVRRIHSLGRAAAMLARAVRTRWRCRAMSRYASSRFPLTRLLRPGLPVRVVHLDRRDLPDGRLRSREPAPRPRHRCASSCLPASGRGELRAWWSPASGTGGLAPGWYLLALLVPVALQVLHRPREPRARRSVADVRAARRTGRRCPVTFVTMLVFVGIGEETGWTAVRRSGPAPPARPGAGRWVVASMVRILWHLPLMLSGDLSWVLGHRGQRRFHHGACCSLFTASGGRLVAGRGLARDPQRRRRHVLLHDGHRRRPGPARRPAQPARTWSLAAALVPRRQSTPPLRRAQPGQQARRRHDSGGDVMTALDTTGVRHRTYDWEDQEASRSAVASPGRAVGPASHRRRRAAPSLRPCGPWGSSRSRQIPGASRSGSTLPSSTSTPSAWSTAAFSRPCWTPRWAVPSTRCSRPRPATSRAS